MKYNYKKLRDYIQQVNVRNTDGSIDLLVGVNLDKKFMPSVANIIGTDLTKYKVIKKGQFGCKFMSVGRDGKLPISLMKEHDKAIISSAYYVFEVKDENKLLSEYLMMWLSRSENDRYLWFKSGADVRGSISWEDFCSIEINIPSIEKQKEIVKEYQAVTNRILLNEKLNVKLEDMAQTIYKEWFVNFEFPNEQGNPYKSSGGEMVYCDELEKEIPAGWETLKIGEISKLKYGKMLDSDEFLENGYPVFSGYGIRGYYSSYMYEEPQILVLCRGVSGTGEVRLSPPKSFITNLSIVIEINNKEMAKYFVYYYLKNQNLRQLDSGSAQSQITIDDLNKFIVLHPMEDVQIKFNYLIKNLINNLNIKNDSNKYLLKLKETLLSKMANVEE